MFPHYLLCCLNKIKQNIQMKIKMKYGCKKYILWFIYFFHGCFLFLHSFSKNFIENSRTNSNIILHMCFRCLWWKWEWFDVNDTIILTTHLSKKYVVFNITSNFHCNWISRKLLTDSLYYLQAHLDNIGAHSGVTI